eukprot:1180877-Prorocentrum_minimum.AAC.3
MLRATRRMSRAIVWMLRATRWTLRAIVWMLQVVDAAGVHQVVQRGNGALLVDRLQLLVHAAHVGNLRQGRQLLLHHRVRPHPNNKCGR